MTGITKVGMIGLSEGNGHPFSFSSIINCYSDSGLAASGWPVIYDYVRRRDQSEFGIDGLKVTHAWTQDKDITKRLCDACLIPNAVSDWKEMISDVDAAIIARDDYENHFLMAIPFLEAGKHVFVDKPLSLDINELKSLRPYLENGQLMSCSGMRYAKELDEVRANINEYGELRMIRGAILNSWEKYGVHLLYAIGSFIKAKPVSVVCLEATHMSISVRMEDGLLMQLDALDQCPRCFRVEVFGSKLISSHEILDNFSMFRRMLWHFSDLIKNGKKDIGAEETIDIMKTLMAGRISKKEKREVYLNEFQL